MVGVVGVVGMVGVVGVGCEEWWVKGEGRRVKGGGWCWVCWGVLGCVGC